MSAADVRYAVENAFRDYETAGVPSSGEHEPLKSDIRYALGTLLQTALESAGAGLTSYATIADRNADTSQPTGTLAYVYRNNGSSTDAANGFYQWTGSAWESAEWIDSLIENKAVSAISGKGFAAGPVTQRGPTPFQTYDNGFHWFVTDFSPPRLTAWFTAGNPDMNGDVQPTARWVGYLTPAEVKNLAIGFTGRLPQANVAGINGYDTIADDLNTLGTTFSARIADFRARALTSTAPLAVALDWDADGALTGFNLSWGVGYSVALGPGVRSFRPPLWSQQTRVTSIGDSMMEGKWVEGAAATLGLTVNNVAKYSSGAFQPYRLGTRQLLFTVTGNSIPASGTGVQVTAINGLAPSFDADPNDAFSGRRFLNTYPGDPIATNCSVSGWYGGRHGVVSVPNGGTTTYTFTPNDGVTTATPVSAQSKFVPDNLARLAVDELWIRMSQNYFYADYTPVFPNNINPRVLDDIQAIVDQARGQRIIILALTPGNDFLPGTKIYDALRYYNNQLRVRWPQYAAYLTGVTYNGSSFTGNNMDFIRQYGRDGSANDQADYDNGLLPRSCMASTSAGEVHLNAKGQALEAQFLQLYRVAQAVPPAIDANTLFNLTATATNPRTAAVTTASASTSVRDSVEALANVSAVFETTETGILLRLVDSAGRIISTVRDLTPDLAALAALIPGTQFYECTDLVSVRFLDAGGRVAVDVPNNTTLVAANTAAIAANAASLAALLTTVNALSATVAGVNSSGIFETTDISGTVQLYIFDAGGRVLAALPDTRVDALAATAATGGIYETTDTFVAEIVLDAGGRLVVSVPSQAAVAAATPTTVAEVVTARGNMPSLSERLAPTITTDGAAVVDQYGRSFLRQMHYRLTKRRLPTPEAVQLIINAAGDSYTHNASRWSGPFMDYMAAKYGDAGGGWCGFGGLPAGNVAPWYMTRFVASITGTTMTVTAVDSVTGALAAGQSVNGNGVAGGTTIVSQINGTPGGIGDYQVSVSQTVTSRSLNGSNQPSFINGNVRPSTYPTRIFGNIAQSYYTNASADLAMATLTQSGDRLFQAFPALPVHDGCDLHFVGTANGVVRYSWGAYNGGGAAVAEPGSYTYSAPVTLNVQGTVDAAQIADIKASMPAGAGALLIEWVSGTAKIAGVNLKSSAAGVRVNKLAATGSNISQWANAPATQFEAALGALGAHAVIYMDGTNSQTSSMSANTWGSHLSTLTGRFRAANAGLDVLLETPAENQRTTNTVLMTAYATEGRKRTLALRAAFVDMQRAFGDPANPTEYGYLGPVPLYVSDLIHPDPLTGGRLLMAETVDMVEPF